MQAYNDCRALRALPHALRDFWSCIGSVHESHLGLGPTVGCTSRHGRSCLNRLANHFTPSLARSQGLPRYSSRSDELPQSTGFCRVAQDDIANELVKQLGRRTHRSLPMDTWTSRKFLGASKWLGLGLWSWRSLFDYRKSEYAELSWFGQAAFLRMGVSILSHGHLTHLPFSSFW